MGRFLAVLVAILFAELLVVRPLDSAAIRHTHKGEGLPARVRRKVGQLNVTNSLLVYMQSVRRSITDEMGNPRHGTEDPTAVWCFMDEDVANSNYREKMRIEERCSSVSRYVFKWESFAESYQVKPVPVQKGILRVFMQVISRLINEGEHAAVDITAQMKFINSSNFTNNHNASDGVIAGHQVVNVTSDSSDFLELDISQGLQALWPPSTDKSDVELILKMEVNCADRRKVPITFVNPAEIPLEQENRRERHLSLQPLLLVYLSDESLKEKLRREEMPTEMEGDGDVANLEREPLQRRRRNSNGCRRENYTVNFADLGLTNVLSPYSHEVGQCVGSCSHTFIRRNPRIANNHAKVMASAHLVWQLHQDEQRQEDPGEPCCVPITYTHVHLFLQHRNQAIELTIFPDFVAKKCGCR